MSDAIISRRGQYVAPPLIIDEGLIVYFPLAVQAIPTGWFLCDGQNNTPDLRNKFVIGSGDTYSIGDTGGSVDAILPTHNHTGTTNTTGAHTHTAGSWASWQNNTNKGPVTGTSGSNRTSSSSGNHSHTLTIDAEGSSGTNANLPPYFSLIIIMKGAN